MMVMLMSVIVLVIVLVLAALMLVMMVMFVYHIAYFFDFRCKGTRALMQPGCILDFAQKSLGFTVIS